MYCTLPGRKRFRADILTSSHFCCQDIKVAEVIIHPDYGLTPHNLAENDIMLVKLSRPAEYNKYVQPVCLPE